jgi:putative nucleotidyltransferase with HDIG domain
VALTDRTDPAAVDNAIGLASFLLRDDPERWRHTQAVATRAEEFAGAVPQEQRDLLISAAYLHDIGYADDLRRTGFHPLDGGSHLRDDGHDPRLAALVAHHSGARFVAACRGLDREMAAFEFREDPLSDALTAADQTTGPNGRPMSVDDRLEDMLRRHGPDSPNAKVHVERGPYLRAAVQRTLQRLARLERRG